LSASPKWKHPTQHSEAIFLTEVSSWRNKCITIVVSSIKLSTPPSSQRFVHHRQFVLLCRHRQFAPLSSPPSPFVYLYTFLCLREIWISNPNTLFPLFRSHATLLLPKIPKVHMPHHPFLHVTQV